MRADNQDNNLEALLAGVAVQAGHLTDISEALIKNLRMSLLERVFVIVVSVVVTAMCGGLIWIGLSNRGNTEAAKTSAALILDCTTPGGKCYQRGEASQASAISQLIKANLAEAWCSVHSATFKDAQSCVAKLLKP